MNYAVVENGIVTNIIWLYPGNEDEFPNAVAMGDIPVMIGDTYDGEFFYRNGEQVITIKEEILNALTDAQIAYFEGVQEA